MINLNIINYLDLKFKYKLKNKLITSNASKTNGTVLLLLLLLLLLVGL
jgi:hypothetical protein